MGRTLAILAVIMLLAALALCGALAGSEALLQPPRRQMDVIAQWKTVDFEYETRAIRDAAIREGEFNPRQVIVLDADAYGEGSKQRVFVTTPRLKEGVPATLSELSRENKTLSPRLKPFPSWMWNSKLDCDNLISVFRVAVDQCGRLWVVDSGTVNVFSGAEHLCPPKLVVFDLKDPDRTELVTRYTFPESQRETSSLCITVAVDCRGDDPASCRDTFAYVADVTEPAILVYDMRKNRSWRVLSNLLHPYPLHGTFNINGAEFDLMDGVLGLAVGPVVNGDRKLFFHSLASRRESWVSCRVLRNESNFKEESVGVGKLFQVSEFERSSQSAAEAMDSNGILYFGLLTENALACWNSRTHYLPHNIHVLAKNDRTMQFASGLKVTGRHVMMLSSRFQNVMVGDVKHEEVNYRVLTAPIDELLRGSHCASYNAWDNAIDGEPVPGHAPGAGRPPYSPGFGHGHHHGYGLHGGGAGGLTSAPISFASSSSGGGFTTTGSSFGFSHITPHPSAGAGSVTRPSWTVRPLGGSPPSSYHHQRQSTSPAGEDDSAIVFRDPVVSF